MALNCKFFCQSAKDLAKLIVCMQKLKKGLLALLFLKNQ
jgi:hypothetical protein